MSREQGEQQPLEVRIGNQYGPAMGGGVRGVLALSGPAPLELGRWIAALTFHELPARFGKVWVYQGGKLLKATEGRADDDGGEARVHAAVLDVDAHEQDAAQAQQIAQRLELRVAGLKERVDTAGAQLQQLRQEYADLLPRVEQERERVRAAIGRLDADLEEHRKTVTAAKAERMAELHAFAAAMASLEANVRGSFEASLATTVARTTTLEKIEASVGDAAVGRRVDAVTQTNKTLELLQKVEEAGLASLLPGVERPPKPMERLAGGVADWLAGNGLDRAFDLGEKIFDKVMSARK